MIFSTKKIKADAIVRAWPGTIVSCVWYKGGQLSAITFDSSSPVPEKTLAEIETAQDTYDAYVASGDASKDRIVEGVLADPGFQAYAKCLNDGSVVPGSNMAIPDIKNAIKGQL